jgi:hypothetical protein
VCSKIYTVMLCDQRRGLVRQLDLFGTSTQNYIITVSLSDTNYNTHKVSNSRCLVAVSRVEIAFLWIPELSPASVTSFSLLTTAILISLSNSETISKLGYARRSVGQSVLVSGTFLKRNNRFLLLSYIFRFADMRRPL